MCNNDHKHNKSEQLKAIPIAGEQISDSERDAIREAMGDRALYLLFIKRELEKVGIQGVEAILHRAIRAYGQYKTGGRVFASPRDFLDFIFTTRSQKVMIGQVLENSDEQAVLREHYCPLYQAWKHAGCSVDEIKQLCGIADGVDLGMTENSPLEIEFGGEMATIGNYCQMAIKKRTK